MVESTLSGPDEHLRKLPELLNARSEVEDNATSLEADVKAALSSGRSVQSRAAATKGDAGSVGGVMRG